MAPYPDERYGVLTLYHSCTQSFSELLKETGRKLDMSECSTTFADQMRSFNEWAEKTGAHRSGRASLDYRLRDAYEVKEMVIELLDNLNSDLQDAISILSGKPRLSEAPTLFPKLMSSEPPQTEPVGEPEPKSQDAPTFPAATSSPSAPRTEESLEPIHQDIPLTLEDSRSSEHPHPETVRPMSDELEECVIDIRHVIVCLSNFLITTINPAPIDVFRQDTQPYDIQQLATKFSGTPQYLIDRCANANSRRRQLFQYHKLHRGNITGHRHERVVMDTASITDNSTTEDSNDREVTVEEQDHRPERGGDPENSPGIITAATETYITVSEPPQIDAVVVDTPHETGGSQLSGDEGPENHADVHLNVPSPPNVESAFSGVPFHCPYCFAMISVTGEKPWRRHVFSDLRPYVCTFEHCYQSNRLFDSRREWFQHELVTHRREWYCNNCGKAFGSSQKFQEHLQELHKEHIISSQMQTVIDRCERPIKADQQCPFCGKQYSPVILEHHLARHMQQIALLVLPPPDGEAANFTEAGADTSHEENHAEESSQLVPHSKTPETDESDEGERASEGTQEAVELPDADIPEVGDRISVEHLDVDIPEDEGRVSVEPLDVDIPEGEDRVSVEPLDVGHSDCDEHIQGSAETPDVDSPEEDDRVSLETSDVDNSDGGTLQFDEPPHVNIPEEEYEEAAEPPDFDMSFEGSELHTGPQDDDISDGETQESAEQPDEEYQAPAAPSDADTSSEEKQISLEGSQRGPEATSVLTGDSKDDGNFDLRSDHTMDLTPEMISIFLINYVKTQRQGLERFYARPQECLSITSETVGRAVAFANSLRKVCGREAAVQLTILTLYDLVTLIGTYLYHVR
ncbi:hypothetical protein K440DRAFT_309169 [Wilcoxina mikolae CBS 423.85]|nr:hypothetical protein K440DRAFT_309169 [Wilcoxina mikolae CBS 423.85]